MPLFDYICENCGHDFETLVLKETESVRCPECGSDLIKKTASPFTCTGVQLNKRLKMASEEQMKKGQEMMRHQKMRRKRINIL